MGTRESLVLLVLLLAAPASGQWVTRDERWQPRGPWNWAVPRELPDLFREFNGIDFGHAHLAETLLDTQDADRIEQARVEILDFIFSRPEVPPDEDAVSPTFSRMVWEARRTFNWAHTFHRSLYDLFASDKVADKEAAYRKLLADYLEKPEAITPHRLDHHGKLWSFPESKSFRDTFPKFNVQIWSYHWLQAAAYDVQLLGGAARQRERFPAVIEHYHRYLREPPVEWEFMPMMEEGAPVFSERFPDAAAIFDNLHMLHDNIDDVLSRPDLYPTRQAQRDRILEILEIYLHRNHLEPENPYAEYMMEPAHEPSEARAQEHRDHAARGGGPNRPPSAADVLSAAGLIQDGHRGQEHRSNEREASPGGKPRARHGGH